MHHPHPEEIEMSKTDMSVISLPDAYPWSVVLSGYFGFFHH
jgi:hypothetical protein